MERNVTFDEKDVQLSKNYTTIPGDVLSEGEREKVIQHPTKTQRNLLTKQLVNLRLKMNQLENLKTVRATSRQRSSRWSSRES